MATLPCLRPAKAPKKNQFWNIRYTFCLFCFCNFLSFMFVERSLPESIPSCRQVYQTTTRPPCWGLQQLHLLLSSIRCQKKQRSPTIQQQCEEPSRENEGRGEGEARMVEEKRSDEEEKVHWSEPPECVTTTWEWQWYWRNRKTYNWHAWCRRSCVFWWRRY